MNTSALGSDSFGSFLLGSLQEEKVFGGAATLPDRRRPRGIISGRAALPEEHYRTDRRLQSCAASDMTAMQTTRIAKAEGDAKEPKRHTSPPDLRERAFGEFWISTVFQKPWNAFRISVIPRLLGNSREVVRKCTVGASLQDATKATQRLRQFETDWDSPESDADRARQSQTEPDRLPRVSGKVPRKRGPETDLSMCFHGVLLRRQTSKSLSNSQSEEQQSKNPGEALEVGTFPFYRDAPPARDDLSQWLERASRPPQCYGELPQCFRDTTFKS
eukprot:gene15466-biopygen11394